MFFGRQLASHVVVENKRAFWLVEELVTSEGVSRDVMAWADRKGKGGTGFTRTEREDKLVE